MKRIFFSLIFYSFVISCTGNNPITPTAPASLVAGDNGIIRVTKIESNSIEIQWQQAAEHTASDENFKYKIYYSLSDNINSVEQAELNGQVAKDWSENITTYNITGLKEGTLYYIIVVVRDKDLNKAVYNMISISTNLTPDKTAPTTGDIRVKVTGFTTVQMEWDNATDNRTSKENLLYKLVYSSNRADILVKRPLELNGIIALDWSKNIYTKTIENLSCSTTYYFALLVKDEAGNMTLHNKFPSTKTKDFEAKIYFENTTGPYKLSNFQMKYSSSDAWNSLNIGYPYLSPQSISTYPSISPQFKITKSGFWFNVTFIGYNVQMTKEVTNLAPGKIYKILFYEQQISPFLLRFMVVYSVVEVGQY